MRRKKILQISWVSLFEICFINRRVNVRTNSTMICMQFSRYTKRTFVVGRTAYAIIYQSFFVSLHIGGPHTGYRKYIHKILLTVDWRHMVPPVINSTAICRLGTLTLDRNLKKKNQFNAVFSLPSPDSKKLIENKLDRIMVTNSLF